jgi:hypothetical protein
METIWVAGYDFDRRANGVEKCKLLDHRRDKLVFEKWWLDRSGAEDLGWKEDFTPTKLGWTYLVPWIAWLGELGDGDIAEQAADKRVDRMISLIWSQAVHLRSWVRALMDEKNMPVSSSDDCYNDVSDLSKGDWSDEDYSQIGPCLPRSFYCTKSRGHCSCLANRGK